MIGFEDENLELENFRMRTFRSQRSVVSDQNAA